MSSSIPLVQSGVSVVATGPRAFRYVANSPVPKPGTGEVLVKIHAAGLNPVDGKIPLYGNWSKLTIPGAISGYDGSGVVVAVGSDVKEFTVGDEVFGQWALTNNHGTFAQYSVTHVDRIVHKPASVSHAEAAGLGIVFLSAWDGFRQVEQTLKSKAGAFVYVPGGSGGVGHVAVQIAKNYGAKVITSASKPEGLAILKDQLGVDYVIDYSKQDVVQEIIKITNGNGADIIYDSTYNPKTFNQSVQALANGGQFIVLGSSFSTNDADYAKAVIAKNGQFLTADVGRFSFPGPFDFASILKPALKIAGEWIEQGKLRVWINQIIQPEEIIAHQEAIRQGRTVVGKIIAKFN
jgi:NADPH2:quinone reductase